MSKFAFVDTKVDVPIKTLEKLESIDDDDMDVIPKPKFAFVNEKLETPKSKFAFVEKKEYKEDIPVTPKPKFAFK